MASLNLHRRDAVLLTAMLSTETANVAMNTLFKAATSKGLNSYTFLVYSYLIGSLLLLPSHQFFSYRLSNNVSFLKKISLDLNKPKLFSFDMSKIFHLMICINFCRSRSLPPLSFSILCKIGLLGLLG